MPGRLLVALLPLATLVSCSEPPAGRIRREILPSREVTFTRDIAPITFQHCVPCHRPGEGAPFELFTYEDVAAHATQIAEVTRSRYMPPWLPEPGSHELAFARRLSEAQIETIAAWVAAGKPRGLAGDLPAEPQFIEGWQLGEPDLIVRMARPFEVPAEGVDIYRNFVIPIPIDRPRWVRAIELQPDNRRVVHHAFMLVDAEGECRRLDNQDETPGFGGMEAEGAESPDGHFISWQPGKIATSAFDRTAWQLTPGTDLVLQMHIQPTGKPERVQAAVGFYFTDEPPTRFPVKLVLRSTDIDIPPGETDYVFEERYTLPIDVELIGLIPHAHYLGKRLEALAILPSGTTEVLLRIPEWDFNWQGDYRFATPPRLPKGTTLVQRFSYDNSPANIRNPNSPPRRVRYGLQSVDEMGELWLQVLPSSAADRETLLRDLGQRALREIARTSRRTLQSESDNEKAWVNLGKATLALESPSAALPMFRRAVQAAPDSVSGHYYLGHALLLTGDLQAAKRELDKVREVDPSFQMAWHDLGLLFMQNGQLQPAEAFLRQSLAINAFHGTSLSNLGLVLLKQNKLSEGISMLERAAQVRPQDQRLRALLDKARRVQGQESR